MSCGAEPGTSGSASRASGDEKDKDMDSSHRVNEPKDWEYSEADTRTAYTPSEEDSYGDESGMRDDFDSEGENSIPGGPRRMEGSPLMLAVIPRNLLFANGLWLQPAQMEVWHKHKLSILSNFSPYISMFSGCGNI